MVFLIEYDRPNGLLIRCEAYDDSDRQIAKNNRQELELELNQRGVAHEVVILEAASKEALRQTHRRYFETAQEIVESFLRDESTRSD